MVADDLAPGGARSSTAMILMKEHKQVAVLLVYEFDHPMSITYCIMMKYVIFFNSRFSIHRVNIPDSVSWSDRCIQQITIPRKTWHSCYRNWILFLVELFDKATVSE